MGEILGIFIADHGSGSMQKINPAKLEAGKGIVGDRYYTENGTFSAKLAGLPDKELTLIESEEIDRFNEAHNLNFAYGDFRRNIVTRGVKLNQLEGREFTVGNIRLKAVRLCEPCAHLASILGPEVMPALVHKAGLRAQIINTGTIHIGEPIAG